MNPDGSLDGTKDDSSNSCEYLDLSVGLLDQTFIRCLTSFDWIVIMWHWEVWQHLVLWGHVKPLLPKKCLLVAQRCGVRKKKKNPLTSSGIYPSDAGNEPVTSQSSISNLRAFYIPSFFSLPSKFVFSNGSGCEITPIYLPLWRRESGPGNSRLSGERRVLLAWSGTAPLSPRARCLIWFRRLVLTPALTLYIVSLIPVSVSRCGTCRIWLADGACLNGERSV